MADKTNYPARHAFEQRNAIPFHRRARQQAMRVQQMATAAEHAESYRAFDDPERFRAALLRSLDGLRIYVQDGNRYFTRDGEVPTLRISEDDAARANEAMGHVEAVLKTAKILSVALSGKAVR